MSEDLTRDLPPEGIQLILAQLSSINTRLTGLEERVDRRLNETRPIWEQVLSRLDVVESRLAGIDGRISGLDERQHRFDEKLTGFDEKLTGFDEKLTGFDEKLTGFDEKLTGFDEKLTGLDNRIEDLGLDMRAGFKRLERQMATIASDTSAVRTDQRDLERRMDRLEDKMDAKTDPGSAGSL